MAPTTNKKKRVIGIQPLSMLSSLTLARRACPLGLLTVLSRQSSQIKPIVYNEEVSGSIFDEERFAVEDFDVVFLSANTGNIKRCVEMAQKFASIGIPVIIGGPEPSMIGPRLLKDNPALEAMVIGPGEKVAESLLCDHTAMNDDSSIIFADNFEDCNPLDYNPPFREIDFQNAKVDYRLLWDLRKHDGLSYFWGNDCAQARKRCFFCGRLAMGVGYRPAHTVWQELLYAYRRGIRFYYNTTDSVTTNLSRFVEFCKAKPSEMKDDIHRVFVNSRDVNTTLVKSLQRLNGVAVIGVESFGNFLQSGKLKTVSADNINSITTLYDCDIRMVLSFVLGLPGETSETLAVSEDGIMETVLRFGDRIDAIHISPLLITSGSPAFKQLMRMPKIRKKYEQKKVPFDIVEMSNDYFEEYCDVSREYCIERIQCLSAKITAIAPHISVGAKGILNEEVGYYELPPIPGQILPLNKMLFNSLGSQSRQAPRAVSSQGRDLPLY